MESGLLNRVAVTAPYPPLHQARAAASPPHWPPFTFPMVKKSMETLQYPTGRLPVYVLHPFLTTVIIVNCWRKV